MRIDIAAQTDIGRRKRNNEDYYGVFRDDTPDLQLFREGALLCVADGLGGHMGGEIASKLAVSIAKDMLKKPPRPPRPIRRRTKGISRSSARPLNLPTTTSTGRTRTW